MNQEQKQYIKEFNKLNKDKPMRLVTKRWDNFFKVFAITFWVLILLSIPVTIIAQDRIDINEGNIIIKIQHEVTQETIEMLIKYYDFVNNMDLYNNQKQEDVGE